MEFFGWFTASRLSVILAALSLVVATLSFILEKTAANRLFNRADNLKRLYESVSNEGIRQNVQDHLELTAAKLNARLGVPTNGFLLLLIVGFSAFYIVMDPEVGPLKFLNEPIISDSRGRTASNVLTLLIVLIVPTFFVAHHRMQRRFEFIKHAKYVYFIDKASPEEAKFKTLLPIVVLRFLLATGHGTSRVRRHLAYEAIARRSHFRGQLGKIPYATLYAPLKITKRHTKNLPNRDLPGKQEFLDSLDRSSRRRAKRKLAFNRARGRNNVAAESSTGTTPAPAQAGGESKEQ